MIGFSHCRLLENLATLDLMRSIRKKFHRPPSVDPSGAILPIDGNGASPLFLIGGVMFLLSGVRMTHLDTRWVWPILLIGIGIAFLLEWLHGKRPAS